MAKALYGQSCVAIDAKSEKEGYLRFAGSIVNSFGVSIPPPESLLKYEQVAQLVGVLLCEYFKKSGESQASAAAMSLTVLGELSSTTIDRIALEQTIREKLRRAGFDSRLHGSLQLRADLIVSEIEPFIVGSSVFDCGCGDGLVGLAFSDKYEVFLGDVVDYRHNSVKHLPFRHLSGCGLTEFQGNSFDTVLLLTVLHHSQHPVDLIREAVRLARQRIVIIESVYGVTHRNQLVPHPHLSNMLAAQRHLGTYVNLSELEQLAYASFIDWFYNRVLHEDIYVPFNFAPPQHWERLFKACGATPSSIFHLGLDQPAVPEFHTLQVFDV